MRRQDVQFFEYGARQPQALYEEHRTFGDRPRALDLFDFSEFGPDAADFVVRLASAGVRLERFDPVRSDDSSRPG